MSYLQVRALARKKAGGRHTRWRQSLELLELSGEMAQLRRGRDDSQAPQFLAPLEKFERRFPDVVNVTLSINPARNRQADQLPRRMDHVSRVGIAGAKHDAADFHRPKARPPV